MNGAYYLNPWRIEKPRTKYYVYNNESKRMLRKELSRKEATEFVTSPNIKMYPMYSVYNTVTKEIRYFLHESDAVFEADHVQLIFKNILNKDLKVVKKGFVYQLCSE